VPLYRFYLLNAANHIANRHDADCADDAHAMTVAAQIAGQFWEYPAIEIWTGERKVIRLSHEEVCATPYPLNALTDPRSLTIKSHSSERHSPRPSKP
jgi:hypothetical protein